MAREDAIQVLTDELGQAAVLRAKGHPHDADLIEGVVRRIRESTAFEYFNFMPESDAMLRTGMNLRQIRREYARLEPRGHAKKVGAIRYYRECMLEPRSNQSASYEAGRRAAAGGAR